MSDPLKIDSLFTLEPRPEVTGLAIGVFDGVHRGHQAIVDRIVSEVGTAASAALTFEPHPRVIIAPQTAPPRLTTAAQRAALLDQAGIGQVLTLHFDETLRQLSAAEFLAHIHRLFPNLQRVASGPNWRFGHDRIGDAATLAEYGKTHHFAAERVEAVPHMAHAISSSRIRESIQERDFVPAAAMLGREYEIEGTVVEGHRRGEKLGFPTANLGYVEQLFPPPGVYVCKVRMNERIYRAVANYGSQPTFGPDGKPVLEVHLLAFKGDLYGKPLTVGTFRFLRPEQKFETVDALRTQIAADIGAA